jgi:hypothetical protein
MTAMTASDEDREVAMVDDNDLIVLPDQTADDLDSDWRDAESRRHRDIDLIADRPPHWDQ